VEPDIGARRAGGRYLYDLATDADARAEFGSDVYDLAVGAGSAMVGLPADLVALASLPHVVNNGGDVDEVFRIPGGSEWISEKLGADTSGLPWLAGQFLDPTGPALDAAKFVAAGAKNFDALALAGMTAWHGSPHKFDRFSLDKIGTGEGAQAYGHGLYFAEKKGVAGSYITAGNAMTSTVGAKAGQLAERYLQTASGDKDEAVRLIGQLRDEVAEFGSTKKVAEIDDAIAIIRGEKAAGNLYEVDIPDEAIDRMLDWDKPLSEQPENFKALQEAARKIGRDDIAESLVPEETGGAAYIYLTGAIGDGRLMEMGYPSGQDGQSRFISETLNELGVPGIKYLDGNSRSAGDGTRNFVVFDENTVKVLSRNGENLDAVP